MKRHFYLAFVGLVASCGSLQAATLLYDFGDTASESPVGSYNNITMNDPAVLSIADSIDSTGANTGISITAEDFWPGSNQSGAAAPSGDAAANFEASATTDNAFGNTVEFGGFTAPLGTVTLQGLDGSGATSYDFTIFAARAGVGDNRETQYDVMGSNTDTAYLNPSNNVSEVAHVNGIVPTVAGSIAIQVHPGPNNNNGFGFYYLGAMRVESNAVPEPASLGLICLGVCSLLATRRFA